METEMTFFAVSISVMTPEYSRTNMVVSAKNSRAAIQKCLVHLGLVNDKQVSLFRIRHNHMDGKIVRNTPSGRKVHEVRGMVTKSEMVK